MGGEVRLLAGSETTPSEIECIRLRVRPHERVHRMRRLRLGEGGPFMVEDVSMPAALFPGLTEQTSFSHRIVVLAQQFGVLLGKGEERITVGRASEEVANALHLAPAAPVLVLDRLVYTLDGRPAEWRLGQCDIADKYYLAEFR